MREIYISTDIETDGPIPGEYSMLSLGSVAVDEKGVFLDSFQINIKELEGAKKNEETMQFWRKNIESYKKATSNQIEPNVAIKNYIEWIKNLEKKHNSRAVFIAYPATFDFMFVYWYMIKLCGESPFSFTALDIKTLAYSVMKKESNKTSFYNVKKSTMPKSWIEKIEEKHDALSDAKQQAKLFTKIMEELK